MSYNLYLLYPPCETCGSPARNVEIRNDSPTYYYSKMIGRADTIAGGSGCTFAAIHNKIAKEAVRWFSKILKTMIANRKEIEALATSNEWGTFDCLVECFREYVQLSKDNPRAVWSQSGSGRGYTKQLCCAGWECEE